MPQLPAGWKETTLGNIGRIITGKTPSTKDDSFWGGGTPFITPTDISNSSRYCTTERTLTKKATNQLRSLILPKNSICYTSIASIGLLCLTQEESLTNQQINSIIVNDDNNYSFYYYYLIYITPFLKKIAGGTTTNIINKSQFEKIPIICPPLLEQKAIAKVLSSFDDKIELLRAENQTLEQMGQELFKEWFGAPQPPKGGVHFSQPPKGGASSEQEGSSPTSSNFPSGVVGAEGKLSSGVVGAEGKSPSGVVGAEGKSPSGVVEVEGKSPSGDLGASLPEGWRVGKLSEIADFLNGLPLQKYPAAEGEESLPVIKIREMKSGITDQTGRASANIDEKYILQNGDVLFSWSGSLELVFWEYGPGALNQHLFKVTSSSYPKRFYYHWILYHLPEFRAIANTKATTMGHIQRGHLDLAKVIIPDSESLIAFDKIMSKITEKLLSNKQQIQSLSATRDQLLPKLMSGEVRVEF